MSWVSWLFLANGAVECSAGLVAFIKPSALPTFTTIRDGQPAMAVRWWGTAVTALGLATVIARNAPDKDVGKQALAAGMLLYHVVLCYYCAKKQAGQSNAAGLAIHGPLALGFACWLSTVRNL